MDFVRNHFFRNEPLTSWTLFFLNLGYLTVHIQVPQIEEKSVQLIRGSVLKKLFLTKFIFWEIFFRFLYPSLRIWTYFVSNENKLVFCLICEMLSSFLISYDLYLLKIIFLNILTKPMKYLPAMSIAVLLLRSSFPALLHCDDLVLRLTWKNRILCEIWRRKLQ